VETHTGKSRGGGGGGLSLIVVVGSEELTVRGIRCQRQPGPLPLIKQRHGETACRNTERQKSALISSSSNLNNTNCSTVLY